MLVDIITDEFYGFIDGDIGEEGINIEGRKGAIGSNGANELEEFVSGIDNILRREVRGNDGIKLFGEVVDGGRDLGYDGAERVIKFVYFDCAVNVAWGKNFQGERIQGERIFVG